MATFYNPKPNSVFKNLKQLTAKMTLENTGGADYVDYLLQGELKEGKGFWKTQNPTSKNIYKQFITDNPHLTTEDPFKKQAKQLTKVIEISNFERLTKQQQKQINDFLTTGKQRVVFAGGPAAKIAAVLTGLNNHNKSEIQFLIDDASLSNESSSASYAHINHANALNAEWASTGLGILPTLIKRNFFGEKECNVALKVSYKSVDLWLKNVTYLDCKLFLKNIAHGFVQQFKKALSIKNDHDKSRLASFQSSLVLDYIEQKTAINLRLKTNKNKAFFINVGKKAHQHAVKEQAYLKKSIGLASYQLSQKDLEYHYSSATANNITSVDVFPSNGCIVHGFDKKIKAMSENTPFSYEENKRITEVCLKKGKAVAVWVEDSKSLNKELIAITSLGLSLGPKAHYVYKPNQNKQGVDSLGPIPHQTLATGVSCQILFKITDKEKFNSLPYTGLHQAHFVEMASNDNFVLVKLTGGGNIADQRYSRSYAINALADMLRVITPECGLTFYDVISAWPCSRGINATNNGQLVRLANNFVVRFAEGGTGMSKMASNAQIIIDMLGLQHGLNSKIVTPYEDYKHTIIDHREKTKKALTAK